MVADTKTTSQVVVGTYVPPKVTVEACRRVQRSTRLRRPSKSRIMRSFMTLGTRLRCGAAIVSESQINKGRQIMTQAPQKTEPRWAELSDDVLESLEAGRKRGIEAVRTFVDEVKPGVDGESGSKNVIDAALKLAEELATTQIEFMRSVVRSDGEAVTK